MNNLKKGKAGWFWLLLLLLVCQGVGAAGALATLSSVNSWYVSLIKPSFNPPSWIFGPVWTLLYGMMALACWLVLRAPGEGRSRAAAVRLFLLQLAANGIWSPLFFGLRNPGLALVDIVILWVLIGLTVKAFRPLSKAAFLLMLPYWAWVSFAALLNFSLWRLNS